MPADFDTINDAVQASLRIIDEDIRRLLLKLDSKDGALVSDKEALANATRVRNQILQYMRSRGIPSLQSVLQDAIAGQAAQAVDDVNLGEFAPRIERNLERVLSGRFDDITAVLTDKSKALASVVRKRAASGASIDAILKDAEGTANAMASASETVVQTAVDGINRQTRFEEAALVGETTGDDVFFAYIGASSGKVLRQWCARHLTKLTNNVYSTSVVEKMRSDPGQPLPVSAYGGGYNCRHQWVTLTRKQAIKRGYNLME